MKALEKDRARRYETASDFAEDVQRYLNDEAVQACPPSAGYRLSKFARRNKGRLITTGLLTVTMLLAISGISWTLRDRAAQRAEIARESSERRQRVTTQVELLLQDIQRFEQDQNWPDAMARRTAPSSASHLRRD